MNVFLLYTVASNNTMLIICSVTLPNSCIMSTTVCPSALLLRSSMKCSLATLLNTGTKLFKWLYKIHDILANLLCTTLPSSKCRIKCSSSFFPVIVMLNGKYASQHKSANFNNVHSTQIINGTFAQTLFVLMEILVLKPQN